MMTAHIECSVVLVQLISGTLHDARTLLIG